MSYVVMSDEYPKLCSAIESYGYNIISSDKILKFNTPEQRHIDMQLLMIEKNIFLLQECISLRKNLENKGYNIILCENNIKGKYPDCVALNCLYLGGKLYGREDVIDISVKNYCKKNSIEIVNVKQGYTRCSTAVICKNSAITADNTIYNALTKSGVDVLKIESGNIRLDGYDYGFIGGACTMLDKDTLAFFGDIKTHPNFREIERFCIIHNVKIINLIDNAPLIDIGGAVRI